LDGALASDLFHHLVLFAVPYLNKAAAGDPAPPKAVPRVDALGDPLPQRALARFGTVRISLPRYHPAFKIVKIPHQRVDSGQARSTY
jgi:hypothetical protein